MNTAKLKKLAEAEIERCGQNAWRLDSDFALAANPAAILKLLAINAELVEALKACMAGCEFRSIDDAHAALAKAEGGEL